MNIRHWLWALAVLVALAGTRPALGADCAELKAELADLEEFLKEGGR
jgi:hypothetical protein